MAQRKQPRDWSTLLEEYRQSGETQVKFCRARGVALSTLSLKLRKAGKPKAFVRVGARERVALELKDGTVLRVSVEDLRAVLRALKDHASA